MNAMGFKVSESIMFALNIPFPTTQFSNIDSDFPSGNTLFLNHVQKVVQLKFGRVLKLSLKPVLKLRFDLCGRLQELTDSRPCVQKSTPTAHPVGVSCVVTASAKDKPGSHAQGEALWWRRPKIALLLLHNSAGAFWLPFLPQY